MHIHVGVYTCTHVYIRAELGSQRWVSSLTTVYLLRHGLSLNLELLSWLNWLVSELQRSTCLFFSIPHPQALRHTRWCLLCGF